MALSFEFLFALAFIYGTNYLFVPGEKYGVPILGLEIISGILFGSIFGALTPETAGYELITSLAAIGLMFIMFEAGLELNPSIIKEKAKSVTEIGIATFVLPFIAGVGFGLLLELGIFASILIGITVSTTSLGLIHPLLEDFGLVESDEGQMILSVTVLNDILSVIALAYATAFTGDSLLTSALTVTAAVIFFLYIAPFKLSKYVSPYLADTLEEHTVRFSMATLAILALLMEEVGIHAVLGSFFAGLLIQEIANEGHDVDKSMAPVTKLVAPIFFFFVGAQLPISQFPTGSIGLILGVIGLGFGAKIFGAYVGSLWAGIKGKTGHMLIGAMPGRLSISIAAAEIGLRQGIISEPLYYSFVILSILSVFVSVGMFRYMAKDIEKSM